MLLKNSNRKPYTIFQMVPLSMTLSDLWPRFLGHDIFLKSNIVKTAPLKDKVTIAQEETIPNIWNGTMFGDLDWLLNASRGFVSISWASCFIPTRQKIRFRSTQLSSGARLLITPLMNLPQDFLSSKHLPRGIFSAACMKISADADKPARRV